MLRVLFLIFGLSLIGVMLFLYRCDHIRERIGDDVFVSDETPESRTERIARRAKNYRQLREANLAVGLCILAGFNSLMDMALVAGWRLWRTWATRPRHRHLGPTNVYPNRGDHTDLEPPPFPWERLQGGLLGESSAAAPPITEAS